MKKRERLEVIHDILGVIQKNKNQIKPTPLLRYSNLSTQRFNEYIKELLGKKFIQETNDKKGRKHFALTDKGFHYLEKYKKIVGFIDEFGL
jgi:predicted transcriptional regulator